jgi:protein gp37
MGVTSKIEWTDASWTPIRARVKSGAAAIAEAKGYTSLIQIAREMEGRVGPHCEKISHGCDHCYSCTNNARGLPTNGTRLPFDRRARDLVDVFLDENILTQPLSWRRSRRIFVGSQTDIWGEWVMADDQAELFAVMASAWWHDFQVLTKRPERMLDQFRDPMFEREIRHRRKKHWLNDDAPRFEWPLPNVHVGVSVENDDYLWRAEKLIEIPAAARFISYEPALGPLNIRGLLMRGADPGQCANCGHGHGFTRCPNYGGIAATYTLNYRVLCSEFKRKNFAIHQVIAGGESGAGARAPHPQWFRDVRDQCVAAGVPFFFKQWGEWSPLSRTDGVHELPFGDYVPETQFGFSREGKHKSGRLLDGREWSQMPKVRARIDRSSRTIDGCAV